MSSALAFVNSEIATLKKVIIHRPDMGIEMITPDKAQEYLYEDIVFLKKMKQEHDVFTTLLRQFAGNDNVYDIQKLLFSVLNNKKVKDDLVDTVCQFENCMQYNEELKSLSPSLLAEVLITGKLKTVAKLIFPPASNLIFCRDTGVLINDHLLVCEASKKARCRESLLSLFIFNNLPFFDKNKIISLSSLNTFLESYENEDKNISIEGGDVMMVHPDHLFIGLSERTTSEAIQQLIAMLFAKNVVKTITQIILPKERYCMHLDTIFTIISSETCVGFEPLVAQSGQLTIVQYQDSVQEVVKFDTLMDVVKTIYPKMQLVPCGGGEWPYAEREQWTDGCNLFALKDGVALTYDRNTHTSKALQNHGYKLINAKKLLLQMKAGVMNIHSLKKTIILIPSDELSRARGGTHCLTFPIMRENTIH